MRMSWFTSLRAGWRPKGKRQKLNALPLRVRQLERRRVLDAAATSVVVSTVVVVDAGQPAPVSTTVNATDAPPIAVPAQATAAGGSTEGSQAAGTTSPGQGLAINTPPVLVSQKNQQVDEGQTLDLSGSGGAPALGLFVDPDSSDTHTATVDWGDGSPVQHPVVDFSGLIGTFGGTHVYADNGTYTVTISVEDNSGDSDTQTFDVAVKNVPPLLVVADDQTVNEGQLLDLNGPSSGTPLALFNDPGLLDTHTATVDWGDGSPVQNATIQDIGGGFHVVNGTHTYADNGVYTVTVTVTDDDGGTASDTFKVTANNVAPFVDLTGPTVVNEGSSNNWQLGPVVDPGADTVTQYIIHWGDGDTDTFSATDIANASGVISHTYADGPANRTIVVDLVDEDGLFESVDTLSVTVNNVTPFVDLTGPTVVNEGSPNSWQLGPVVDPGADTVTQYIIDWGDGNTDTFTAMDIANLSGVVSHTYADGLDNHTITLDLVDGDGAHVAVDTLAVTVNNVPPTVDLTGPTTVNEGAPNTWLLGSVVDPGVDTVSQYVIHWGDGDTDTYTALEIAQMSSAVPHTYTEGPGNHTITVDLVDEDGTYVSVDSLSVTVKNVAPSVTLDLVSDVDENGIATVTGSYTDPGVEDPQTMTVAWGDPNNTAVSTFTVPAIQESNGTPTLSVGDSFTSADGAVLTITSISAATGQVGFSVQRQYLDDGLALGNGTDNDVSTIGVTVKDDEGESGNDSTTVTIHNVAPTVTLGTVADISENGVATLTGSYADIGKLDAHKVTVSWGDLNNGASSIFSVSAIQNATGNATLSVGNTFTSSTGDGAVLTITAIDSATGTVSFSVQHLYLDDGFAPGNGTASDSSTIGVTVADDDGQSGSNSTTVTVNDVAPSVVLNPVLSINENGSALLIGSYTDVGLLDAHTLTVNWGDLNNTTNSTFTIPAVRNASGTITLNSGDSFTSADGTTLVITSVNSVTGQVEFGVERQYLDDGAAPGNGTASDASTITVTVADDDTLSGSNTTTVTVNNAAPAVGLSGASGIFENGVATLGSTYSDAGRLDAHVVTIDWGDLNNSTDSSFAVPALQNAGGTATLNVGDTFDSADGAVLTITGINTLTGEVSFTVQHQYLDDGQAPGNGTSQDDNTVTITVTDDDGQTGTGTATISVRNVLPGVLLNSVSGINENGIATLTGTYTDPGLLDGHTLTITWDDPNHTAPSIFTIDAIRNATGTTTLSAGDTFSSADGAVLTITAVDATTGQVSFSVEHQYLDDGFATTTPPGGNNTGSDTSTITVTIADDDGDNSSDSTTVTVDNVAPVVALNAVSSINENGIATLTGSYTDIGLQDAHRITINWGDLNNTASSVFDIPATSTLSGTPTFTSTGGDTTTVLTITSFNATTGLVTFSVQHQYLDDGQATTTPPGGNNTTSDTSTITVTVADDDTGSETKTTSVVVNNVAPVVSLNAVSSVSENGFATVTGSYTDIGLRDTHRITINWGDLNNSANSVFDIPATSTLSGTPTFTSTGADSTTVLTITSFDAITGVVTFSVQHQYLDDGQATTTPPGGNNTPSDVSTITVAVADDDAQSGSNSTTVTVNNVAPTVALGAVTGINENGVATLTGSYTDIGRSDAHTVTVSWGDLNNTATSTFSVNAIRNAAGTPTLSVGNTFSSADGAVLTITAINATTGQVSFSVQHQYLDDGFAPGNGTPSDVSTIGVTVADDDGQSGSNTTTVTVSNVVPAVTLGSVSDINENGIATLTGSYTDIGKLDVHTLTINWGDTNNTTLSTFTIPAIQNATGTPTLSVGNTFTSTAGDGTVLTITAVDASTGKVSFSVDHQYLDDGLATTTPPGGNNTASDTSTITVTVADDDGQSGFNTTSVIVHNVTPVVALNAVSSISENGIATLTGSYTDIGLQDAHRITINWGDVNNSANSVFDIPATSALSGTPTFTSTGADTTTTLTITSFDAVTGLVTFTVQHQYLDDGQATATPPGNNNTASDVSTITVTVADDDAQSGNNTTTVTINNAAPSVVLNSVSAINENGIATLTGSYTDIGLLDVHTVTIGWGDLNNAATSTFAINAIRNATGTVTLNVNDTFNSADGSVLTITAIDATIGTVSFSVQHQYLDDGQATTTPPGGNNTPSDPSTITVTVADDDTASNSTTTTVTVNNVAPVVALNAVSSINENGFATLTGSYTDIGLQDVHKITIDWGDLNNGAASVFNIPATSTLSGTPTFTSTGADSTTVLTITSFNATTGLVTFSVQHQYLDDGRATTNPPGGNNTASDISTITVTVADDDTGSDTTTTSVTVNNVAPVVALNAVSSINENGIATLTGSYTDIGLQDAHRITISWGDLNNPADSVFDIPATSTLGATLTFTSTGADTTTTLTITSFDPVTGVVKFTVEHQYLDDGLAPGNGTTSDSSTISVNVADDDAGDDTKSTTVIVHNVTPKFTFVSTTPIDEGHVATISLIVDDPGTLDVFTFTVDWRDGTTATIADLGSANSSGDIGATHFEWNGTTRQLTLSHLYPDNANYPVEIRMADDDMAQDFGGVEGPGNFVLNVTTVTVKNVPPALGLPGPIVADEGQAVSLTGLGIKLTDVGFDNPNNLTVPPLGDQTHELLAASFINWGDGTAATTPVDIINRVSGAPTSQTTASLTLADFLHASHAYADNGTYTVTVRVADDNMGAFNDNTLFSTGVEGVDFVDLKFTITINNVAPTISTTIPGTLEVFEGSAFNISSTVGAPLQVQLQDPGFDNSANPNSQPGGTVETFFGGTINWGDGTPVGTVTINNSTPPRIVGQQGQPTTVLIDTTGHTYADDGVYTVTIQIRDDDMANFVERTFTITVKNVAPSFVAPPGPPGGDQFTGTDLTSGGVTNIHVDFDDPGFDNTNNPNLAAPNISDPRHETFTHVMDWGEGIVDAVHTYADSGPHTVTVTRSLLDGSGAIAPVTFDNFDSLRVLTLVSSQDVTAPDSSAQTYKFTVNWGDGVEQTIVLTLKNPGAPGLPQAVPNQPYLQTVVSLSTRDTGTAGTPTAGGFDASHTYFTPPDPLSPTDPIPIRVFIVDDNNGSVDATITVANPGISTFNVAIDTTPDVPRLALASQQLPPALLTQQSAAPSSLQPNVARVARSELVAASDRYLELAVVSPDGVEREFYRLSDEALVDLRRLFATLPDNRYKIYLVRTDNINSISRRLVMDVFVRHGRVVDPSDDSEGTRDRPPKAEGTQQNNAQQKIIPQINGQQNGGPQKQVVPLQNNPLLNPLPNEKTGAANEYGVPAITPEDAAVKPNQELSQSQPNRLRGSMKWALPLAGLGLVANRESWSERLGAALETADEDAWQRLRRAGRLGRNGRKSGDKPLVGQEKAVCDRE